MLTQFPDCPGELTPAWLGEILACEVVSLACQPIGTGQVGDSFRLTVAVSGEDGPRRFAAKFAAADPTSRATAAMFSLYVKEVNFYRDIAPHLAARTPEVHFAAASEDGTRCLLLMEDLGPARQGDQVAGCDLADARAAMVQAAAIHGSSWQRTDLLSADWLAPVSNIAELLIPAYGHAQLVFRERYEGLLEPESMAICEGLAAQARAWFTRPTERTAILHGDFRLDNMLFGIHGGKEPLAILDWQTVSAGNPLTDVGYFLGCGIGTDLRRAYQDDLLALYRSEMANFGVSFQESAFDFHYRIGALHGVATAVFSAANVERTDRGDANFLSMARGACSLARDVGSLDALAEMSRHADQG